MPTDYRAAPVAADVVAANADYLDAGQQSDLPPAGRSPSPASSRPQHDDPAGKDYSPVLPGEGDNDYARYMRTGVLLSLQRRPDQAVHRDELLFQTVHQTTELWLKHACFEIAEAARQIRSGSLETATRLLGRAALGMELITGQLEMLRHLGPWDFQTIRIGALGHGSGFESPGWQAVQTCSDQLAAAFTALLEEQDINLIALYRASPDAALYRLAEALIEWDERVSLWRVRHYKVATRIIGHQVVGTKGTPVDVLTRLIAHKFFPELWRVRTELTLAGPLATQTGQAAARAEAR